MTKEKKQTTEKFGLYTGETRTMLSPKPVHRFKVEVRLADGTLDDSFGRYIKKVYMPTIGGDKKIKLKATDNYDGSSIIGAIDLMNLSNPLSQFDILVSDLDLHGNMVGIWCFKDCKSAPFEISDKDCANNDSSELNVTYSFSKIEYLDGDQTILASVDNKPWKKA